MPYASTDEVIATLASIPDRVEAAIQEADSSASSPAPAGDEGWSAAQVLGHLGDSSRYWGARFFRVAREEEPRLPGVDQDALMIFFAHGYRPSDELLQGFRLTSAGNVALLRSLPAGAWARVGIHEERGRMTLREMAEVEADHELVHVRQLREALGLAAE
jgi:DinB superfamily